MDCLAGVGIAAASGTFEYNRDNFQEDRKQRRRAAVQTMSWRVDQAKLWREDVRDLISLTEYKMRMYLIVNVLLCGMDIFLWTEGELPRGTPHWLMVGSTISIGSSFNFLVLSIWLAMYAAVSAQSYEVRLVTQMVRLPIPTWEELEGSRTYGSEFEKLEARQMFRVPYVMGWQENLVRAGQAPLPAQNFTNTARNTAATQASAGVAVDPWGLEQSADSPELGCRVGADVARLRHINMVRHAAIQWQTYDGFARICMSIGVQQLMLAMIYYLLGYLFVEVHCIGAATTGVIGFTIIAETILQKDTSLPASTMRLAQFLLGAGPIAATIGAANWGRFDSIAYRYWAVAAFVSHALYFGLISLHCRIREFNNGAWLPVAFRSVLYLDAFCWICPQAEGHSLGIEGRLATIPESDVPAANRPGVQTVRYDDHGRPVPVRASSTRGTQDMRDVEGAPDTSRLANAMEARSEDFYTNVSFLPPEAVQDEHHDEAESAGQGWSERLGPGDLPWRVFMSAIIILVLVWLFAAVYAFHGVFSGFSWDLGSNHHESNHPTNYQPWEKQTGKDEWKCKEDPTGKECNSTQPTDNKTVSFLSQSQIMLEWPHLSIRPNRLSCDASGQMIILSDSITLFGATVHAEKEGTQKLRAVPRELHCPALFGEGLDDVSLSCNSSAKIEALACDLLALHGHGRKITRCPLTDASGASQSGYVPSGAEGATMQISDSWFENFHPSHDIDNGNGRSRIEKPSSVSVNPTCTHASGHQKMSCVVVGTSHGRVVQLGQRSNRKNLIPAEVLHEERHRTQPMVDASSVRAFNDRYLGVLHTNGRSIRILDMSKGGLLVGTLDMELAKPAISFCAGGGNFFVLTKGAAPELWKIPVPREFAND